MYTPWNIIRPLKGMKLCHLQSCAWAQRLSYRVKEGRESNNNAYLWNLDKWYRCFYLHGRNRDTDFENKYMGTKGEGGCVG